MPGRNIAVRHTARRFVASMAVVLLCCGWSSTRGLRAAPFETESAVPSVLAAPTGTPPGGVIPGSVETGQPWEPSEGISVADDGPLPGTAHLSDGPGHYDVAFAGDDACPPDWGPPGWGCRNACWTGRVDGLLLWRDAPPGRPLVESGAIPPATVLDANQLNSTATGGVKASILRIDGCSGNGWEGGYIYAGNFTARAGLPEDPGFTYTLAPPGIYGGVRPFTSGTAALLARLQGAEFNRLVAGGPNFRWLAGFRWLQWHERFTLDDTFNDGINPLITDFYQTSCNNNLYGGQIGVDARLVSLGILRVDSVVKAGAYYNVASQSSTFTTDDPASPGTASVSVSRSPASCSFVGEVGLTGVLPLTSNLDFRFGYVGLWLTGLAQPTQQLSGQQLTPGFDGVGTLTATGGTILQGVTLGLEARW